MEGFGIFEWVFGGLWDWMEWNMKSVASTKGQSQQHKNTRTRPTHLPSATQILHLAGHLPIQSNFIIFVLLLGSDKDLNQLLKHNEQCGLARLKNYFKVGTYECDQAQ